MDPDDTCETRRNHIFCRIILLYYTLLYYLLHWCTDASVFDREKYNVIIIAKERKRKRKRGRRDRSSTMEVPRGKRPATAAKVTHTRSPLNERMCACGLHDLTRSSTSGPNAVRVILQSRVTARVNVVAVRGTCSTCGHGF